MESGLYGRPLPEQRCAAAPAVAPATGRPATGVTGTTETAGGVRRLGRAGPPTALSPGGDAVATCPPISTGERTASVTVSGDPGRNDRPPVRRTCEPQGGPTQDAR